MSFCHSLDSLAASARADDEDDDDTPPAPSCEFMLEEQDLPPVSHAGGKCRACGYWVEPLHDSVGCAFALAAERDSLRCLVRAFILWGLSDGVLPADLNPKTDQPMVQLVALRGRAAALHADVPELWL